MVFVKRCLAPSAPQVVDVADDGGAPKLNVTRSDYADTCKRTGQKCYLLVGITWKTARVCVCLFWGVVIKIYVSPPAVVGWGAEICSLCIF